MIFDFSKKEKEILKFWKEKKIFEKLRKKNGPARNAFGIADAGGGKRWSFLDGPITANNPMGVHHAWGRTYKDLFQRYKAMQGFDQRFQNGFDCQGLWVEVEVEKELGFKNKKDIEKFGIAEFVEKCKQRVLKYSKIQTEQSIRLGQWMDWDNSYYTMSEENNYVIWNFLKKCWQKGFLYKGRDVVPWCPRCGTSISQHEILTEEYKEITHKSIIVKLPLLGRKKTFFLVWTTTPWTLPANVALAVHPELTYAEIENKEGVFIALKEKFNLVPGGKIIKYFPGQKLEGLKYRGMLDEFPEVKKNLKKGDHKVILWKDVTQEEGTGIVHIAPGCGQEDFHLSKKFNLPVIDPTNEESRYRDGFGFLTGRLVSEVNDLIFNDLAEKDRVFKIEDYKHRYPTCWRCKKELIFRLVDEWYIAMAQLRKSLMKVAGKIKWIPSFGLERELDWLRNMQDWLISKKRYWGLALPIFECPCGNFEVMGSKEELRERVVSGWEGFEGHSPHRPRVDGVRIKCSKCGKEISRIKDVGNPWLDAGIVPFSTMSKEWFPAELVCESFPGQFKNWFYSLIVMSAVLEGTNPMKTVFGYASVKDEKGEEMHKSKGNAIWFDEAVEKIGADVMRWMYARQNPVNDLKFGYGPAEEIKRKIINLHNIYTFFITYVDKKEYPKFSVQCPMSISENLLDRWIISRINNLIKKVTKNLDEYNVGSAVLAIENFFIDDFSLWYLRRSRKRFHSGHPKRREAIETFYAVFLNLIKLIAPIMPFSSEQMYQNLRQGNMPESIHLLDWPKSDKKSIDKKLEEKMDEVREIVALALAQRAEAGIKVRQPLASLQIKNKLDKALLELIKDEVNVKKITFGKKLKLDTKITRELKEEGEYRELVRNINKIRKEMRLTPRDRVVIESTFGPSDLKGFKKEVGAEEFLLKKELFGGEEIKIDGKSYYIKIKKL
ncbi:MAG: isoleucine--tRNA ligase [Candidatus Nealsonbacteria bacterium]|nr:isoleucine--tRNA ligase [Candidatus Nealsonbacteria bacterium]